MDALLNFISRLEESNIYYTLEHNRDETIVVVVTVPGERWEVEFYSDGNVEIEIFKSQGEIKDKKEIERLFEEFGE
jgi:hypothetical protein